MKTAQTWRRITASSIAMAFLCAAAAAWAQNTPPVISSLPNRTIGANLSTTLAFRVGDAESPASSLTLSAASTNIALVALTNIVFGGSDSNRTVRVSPVTNQIGTSIITITVTDPSSASASSSFLLTVTNTPPVFSGLVNRSINALIPSAVFPFTIGDRETSEDSLTLIATSTNQALMPVTNIVFGGSASNRTVQFFPLDQLGTTSISFILGDSLGGRTTNTFQLTVFNSPPVISGLPYSPIIPINSVTNIPLTVGDVETPATNLVVTVFSSNPNLVPNGNLALSGTGTNRTLQIVPATNQVGTTTVSAVVTDSLGARATNTMLLSVYQFVEVPGNGLPGLWFSAAAWGDYDNDGLLDLALVGSDPGLTPQAYILHNNGDGTFTDIHAGLPGLLVGSVAWGDYDNDGYLDLALSGGTAYSGSAGTTRIFHNNRDGTFTDINAGLPGLRTCSVAWGDYNNDGALDLIISGWDGTQSVTKLYRNDHGQFIDSGAVLPALSHGSVAWGDYDNDGDLDLLIAGVNDNNQHFTRVLRNEGNGVFIDINAPLYGLKEGSVAWGDYDNDGDLDILVAGSDATYSGYSFIYRNDGNNTFTDAAAGLPGTRTVSVAWGDFDNDGWLDFAFGWGNGPDTPPPQPHVYRNVNGGYVDSGNVLYGFIDGPTLWGDYDGDGRLDILTGGYAAVYGQGVYATKLYRNYGPVTNTPPSAPTGLTSAVSGSSVLLTWSASANANQSGTLTYNVRVGSTPGGIDVLSPMSASTGLRCIVADGNAGHNLTWNVRNLAPGTYYWSVQAVNHGFRGSAFASEGTFVVPSFPSAPSAFTEAPTGTTCYDATLNGSANPDGVATTVWFEYGLTTNYGASTASQAIGGGTAEVRVQASVARLNPASTYHVRLVAANSFGTSHGQDRTFTTSPYSQFSEVPVALPGVTYGLAGWGDFDKDGRLDLYLAGYTNSSYNWGCFLLHNEGNGAFTALPNAPIGTFAASSPWGDFDNDNNLDPLLDSGIYRNTSNGVFTSAFTFPLAFIRSLTWVDYDNDGRADVDFCGQLLPNDNVASYLFHNDGQGQFSLADTNLLYNSGLIAWADFNNDGALDALCASARGLNDWNYYARLFQNQGGGVFTDTQDANLQWLQASSMVWGDFDNDGSLDVALLGTLYGTNYGTLLRNDGNGGFAQTSVNLAELVNIAGSPSQYSLQCADYDNDGQLDLLVAGSPNSYLLRNLGNFNFANSGIVFSNTMKSLFFGDYDGDGDLDIIAVGAYDGQLLTRLFRNNSSISNAPPNAPSGLQTAITGNRVVFSWDRATDSNQTNGFTYNLRIGTTPGGTEIMSPLADAQTGLRRAPQYGNAGTGLGWHLNGLAPGVYYWSVQAIDHSFAGSPFSVERTFVIQPRINGVTRMPNNQFAVQFEVSASSTYTLQVSSNLVAWADLTHFTSATNGLLVFTDSPSQLTSSRFYRLRIP